MQVLYSLITLHLIIVINFKFIIAGRLERREFLSEEQTNVTRDSRFLPILTVIRIPNSICTFNGEQGACKTRRQCQKEGGVPFGGNCGNGYGVCCMITKSCSATSNGQPIVVNTSGTHLVQPSTYTPPLQCQFNIPRKPGVCQVRLDFVHFILAQPDSLGDCLTDMMTITGADNLQNFITCGEGTGQHLYLHYVASNSFSITINLNGNATSIFDLLVTFVECGSTGQIPFKVKAKGGRKFSNSIIKPQSTGIGVGDILPVEPAPPGCSQYYTKSSNTVQSFNYHNVDIMASLVQYQINNQKYSVCVKSAYGSKKIMWQPCTLMNEFFVSGSAGQMQMPGDPPCTDYVDIPGSTLGRYYGSTFPNSVTSTLKPYAMYVNFDGQELIGLGLMEDPRTGCLPFFDCRNSNGLIVGPVEPPTPPPCGPNSVTPGNQCVASQFLIDRSDFYNTGFCLRYTLS